MNVLVLTPDRVGSTLLQRLITIYMQIHDYDRPVINLHELTNGIMKYYSPVFNREVLGRNNDNRGWGYYQSLEEITELLAGTDHYKTSRLAHYHIVNRKDTVAQQVPFYEYLNNNFFIISAQRENLLEHGLSWCIFGHSKNLNVYNHQDKVNIFSKIYRDKITVDLDSLGTHLWRYRHYLDWVQQHFTVNSYFHYEKDLLDIEKYILNLDIFHGPQRLTWQDKFDINFKDWNRCHYLTSDLSGIGNQLNVPQLGYDKPADVKYELQSLTLKDIGRSLSVQDQKFMSQHAVKYVKSYKNIQELVENKVLVTGVPIKLQTMLEKKLLIKNFDECVDFYNDWVARNNVGKPYSESDIEDTVSKEMQQWHAAGLLE
jgi:hypothetical protein